jgi:multidrug efflux system membrane fusion protein
MSAEQASANASVTPVPAGPPVKRSRRKHWIIWAAALLLFLTGGYLLSQRSAAPSGPAAGKRGRGAGGAIPVSVATVRQGNMDETISGLGTVTAVYTVTLTSRVAGQLAEIHYKEGQMVHKGQLLAVVDPRPYQASLLSAQGQLERDQALLANARIDLDRYRMAYGQHAIPEQTVATQQAAVNQDLGTVKLDQGNVDAAKVNVDYTQITSPIDGRVGLRQTDLGNIVAANGTTAIVTITQLQPITVIFTMAEDFIADVTDQMRAGHKLRVDALNRDDQTELAQGAVLTVDNLVDVGTGTVKVRAIFSNHDNKLFPNEFVNARLLVKTLMGVNIIPNAAVQRNNDVSFVYIVNPDKTVKSRNVTVATNDGTNSAVTGVSPGEVLVTDGFDKLQDGTKIVIRQVPGEAKQAPPMNQASQNTQAPTKGAANTNINTAQQNPQQPSKGQKK